MQNKTEELKNILVKATNKALDFDVSDMVEVDDFAAFIHPDLVNVICGVEINGHNFEFDLSKISDNCYKFIVYCGGCKDVVGANKELRRYAKSEIAKVLYQENEIEGTSDPLQLSAEFIAESKERATEVLTDIISNLADEEKSEPLTKLLKYFN